MAETSQAIYVWTGANTSRTKVKDGGAVNGYWSKTNGFPPSGFSVSNTKLYTITDIKISFGSSRVLVSNGAYLQFGEKLQTQDLSYAAYSTYASHANIPVFCKKDVCAWVDDCASRGTVVRLIPRALNDDDAEANLIEIAKNLTATLYITYIRDYNMNQIFTRDLQGSVTAGQPYTVPRLSSGDFSNLRFKTVLALKQNYVTVESITQEFPVGTTSFAIGATSNNQTVIPLSWAQHFPFDATVSDAVSLTGYCYDTRTIFTGQTVNDHGFGFADIEPDPVVTDGVSRLTIDFITGVSVFNPTIDDFSVTWSTPLNGWKSGASNIYLKDYTGVTLEVGDVTVSGGAALDRYYIQMYRYTGSKSMSAMKEELAEKLSDLNDGDTVDMSDYTTLMILQSGTGTAQIESLSSSGTIAFAAYARDTRGLYSNVLTDAIFVREYALPAITVSAYRSDSSGTAQDNGLHIHYTATIVWDNVPVDSSPWNAASLAVKQKISGGSSYSAVTNNADLTTTTSGNVSTSTWSYTSDSTYSTSNAYEVQFIYTDNIINDATGLTAIRTTRVTSASYTMHFKQGGTGIGFGKSCSNNNSIEINPDWTIRLGETPMITFTEYGVQPSISPSGFHTGLIWLEAVQTSAGS